MIVGTRDTPPDIQDGPFGWEPRSVSSLDAGAQSEGLDPATAQRVGRECYDASTNWLNSSRRARWNDSLRAFQSLHPTGSKYLSRDYSYRSTLYRPKTRTMVRKAETQTASAFFSNEDVVSITPQDEDDILQVASADVMQELLQYRLTKTIPWFLTIVGARQDMEVMGVAIAKPYWKYSEEDVSQSRMMVDRITGQPILGADGQPIITEEWTKKPTEDHPWIDLIAPENFRFEPGADWRDPVGTSPYLIELIPMYITEVREKIESGEWLPVAESALLAATDLDDDPTRRSREQGRVPGKDHDAWKPRTYDICWVRENIVKWGGKDWHFMSVGSAGELLTEPVPLEEVYLHGERPYVVGSVMVETHKSYPSSKVELVRDLQRAANDDWNLRFDNVKLVLNPRQFVRKGKGIEITDVRNFMPGKVVLVDDPQTDVYWDRPPPPDQSAYAEQDRINLDFDDLTGDFTNSSVEASQLQQQSATGMHLMSGQASGMNEYELRVFAETFVEPVIRQLIKLEQAYETDPVVLSIAGKNAQIIQKYGISQITDELLNQELTTKANVGIGATNPQLKLRNFAMAGELLGKMFGPTLIQGANFEEIVKEVMGLSGYKDGSRFFKPNFDPRVAMLQQQIQQLQKKGGGQQNDQSKVMAAKIQADGRLKEIQTQGQFDNYQAQLEFKKEQMAEQSETWRELLRARVDMMTRHAPTPASGIIVPHRQPL